MKNRIRNFDIQNKLGSGSYGVIYKAINKATKETCVLKQISLTRLSEKARKNAINEATIMGKLIHPFIVRYKQSFIEENVLNIVMEFCDSGDLSNYLKLQNKKPLKEDKIWKFFIEICVGMEYIHKNKILHRDIKTLNIFMNKNQEIKIGDLGVAKMLTSNQFAQTMVGTPFYLSPQLCEEKPYNEKSDIWALGCLLYELCTYRHPFEAQNQASLILKIIRGKYLPIPEFYSKELKQLIDSCLERDYKRRPTASNLLDKPRVKQYTKAFNIEKIVEEYMQNVKKDKNSLPAKPNEQVKVGISAPVKVKAIENEPVKQPRRQQLKKEEQRKQQIKRQEPKKQPSSSKPIISSYSQKKIQKDYVEVKRNLQQNIPRRQSKNQFMANLEKMIDEGEKNKKVIKQGPSYADVQIKKDDKIQRVMPKEEIKQLKKQEIKTPSNNQQRKNNPIVGQKKSNASVQVFPSAKKQEIISKASQLKQPSILGKPPLMPSRPPIPPNQNKQPVLKVKNQKNIQPKVYQSQKQIHRPQGIIKSGGFNNLDMLQKNEKAVSNSKEKGPTQRNDVMSAKRSSIHVRQQKVEKDEIKQLFGGISPNIQHKSQKKFSNITPSVLEQKQQAKKEDENKVSRVRKGGQNLLARNAKNASRYNQISKQEQDLVMNLPNLNKGESSDSEEECTQKRQIRQDLKAKTNKAFQLKEVNDSLVLQKYEDMMRDSELERQTDQNSESEEEIETNEQFDKQINNQIMQDKVIENQNIIEDISYARKNSANSSQQIEQALENENLSENLEKEEDLEQEFSKEDQLPTYEQESQWSFDQQPELPMLQQKQSPYFQENNMYLVEQDEENVQNKINYLQIKLEENLKREDEINKLMQIKINQCRKFILNEKVFQEILEFFRKKINMDEEYTENDEKEVENFLKKKGLTEHRKFQNIYKIMHFETELENTRKIIQKICKKLSEFESN